MGLGESMYLAGLDFPILVLVHLHIEVWRDIIIPHVHVALRKALLPLNHLTVKHQHSTAWNFSFYTHTHTHTRSHTDTHTHSHTDTQTHKDTKTFVQGLVLLIHIFHIIPQVVCSLIVTEIQCNLKTASN